MRTLNQKDIKALIGSHESYRGDCHDCGGANSLSISCDQGDLKWLCFKAHCKNRGQEAVRRSTKEITNALLGRQKEMDSDISFDVPSHFTSMYSSDKCIRFFKRYQAIRLAEEGHIKLRYDPKQDRAVFLVTRKGRVVDATGRALGNATSKWWRYNGSGQSFILNHHGMDVPIIVVEDIPSACIAGYNYNAIALMGTSLSDLDLRDLMKYNKVIVALDPDAYSKGVEISRRLSPFVDASAVLIPDDLKYFKPNEVKEMFV
tara:strand:+ start:14 stop:793 length:780 start_codon:yes stop_codon:yes gene_type:complete